jgi:O-antigen/teichoic acid export membrane protein
MEGRELNRRLLSSSFWLSLSGVANQFVSFVIFVVIARLVTPAEFGLVAMAALMIELMQILATAGIADAVIQRPELDDRAADSAFWLNFAGGVAVAALAVVLAGPIDRLFGVAGLGRVIRILSLTFVMAPLGAIHAARLAREFGFRALALRNLGANLLSGAIGIWIALSGGGVDALVAQRLAAAAAISVIGFLSYRWVPRLRLDLAACRQMLVFGGKIMSSQILLMGNVRSIELIAGFVLGPVGVATIRVANRCIDMLMGIVVVPFQQMALPFLSRMQHDPAALQRGYASLSRFSALVIYPSFAGALALAPVVVPTMFGMQWREAGAVMQVICIAAIPMQFNVLLPATLAAAGRPGQVFGWSAAQLGLGITAAVIGSAYGVFGLVSANQLRAYLLIPLGIAILRRKTGIGAALVLGNIARPLAASVAMAGCVALLEHVLAPIWPVSAVLGCGVVAGAVIYGVLVLLLMPDLVAEVVPMLPARLREKAVSVLGRLPGLMGAKVG